MLVVEIEEGPERIVQSVVDASARVVLVDQFVVIVVTGVVGIMSVRPKDQGATRGGVLHNLRLGSLKQYRALFLEFARFASDTG
jgi:hypothetical protein